MVEVEYLRNQNTRLTELESELTELLDYQEKMLRLAGIEPALRRDGPDGDNSYELGALDSTGTGTGAELIFRPVGGKEIRGFSADHPGIDIQAKLRNTVLAAGAGVVVEAGLDPRLGYRLVIDHGDSLRTVYANNESNLVTRGDSVEAGQVISLVGAGFEGDVPHLHFEVLEQGEPVSPRSHFPDSFAN
jgi:murein DD-endopeptidase MepM/ murein hydrolase activator NlpD